MSSQQAIQRKIEALIKSYKANQDAARQTAEKITNERKQSENSQPKQTK